MITKIKDNFEKTRHVKNNDKFKKYVLRGQRNARYFERILSNKKKSYNLVYLHFFESFYNYTCTNKFNFFYLYKHYFVIFLKNILDTELEFSGYTNILMGYRMVYHTLF